MKHVIRILPFAFVLLIATLIMLLYKDIPADKVFDWFLSFKPPIDAPSDLVIIDTSSDKKNNITQEELSRLLRMLTILDSRFVVVESDISDSDSRQKTETVNREELVEREFNRIQKNITTLFEGIRMGSIKPQDADRFVKELQILVDAGKRRVLFATLEQSDAGNMELEKSIALFKHVLFCDDIDNSMKSYNAMDVWGGQAVYSRVEMDADGVLRRMYPIKEQPNKHLVHAGLALLTELLGSVELEQLDRGIALKKGEDVLVLPTDDRGRFFVVQPVNYTTIPVSELLEYQEIEKKVYDSLKEMERSGYFRELDPLQYPTTLYEYAQYLEQEALENPVPRTIQQWKDARQAFYQAVSAFLSGPAEAKILKGYQDLLQQQELTEEGKERIQALHELTVQSFAWARKAYGDLAVTYSHVSDLVQGSYCIIGPRGGAPQATLALISTILSKNFIYPLDQGYVWVGTCCTLLFLFLLSYVASLWVVLVVGASIATACILISFILFLSAGYWFHPFLPAILIIGALGCYVLSVLLYYLAVRRHQEIAFKSRVSPGQFRRLLQGIPLWQYSKGLHPETVHSREGLFLCVRHGGIGHSDEPDQLEQRAFKLQEFRQRSVAAIRKEGGTVLWMDGELLFAVFGVPVPEEPPQGILKALAAFRYIKAAYKDEPVTGGLDYGSCAFYYDNLGGYTALGRCVVYSRILSNLALKYKKEMLLTEAVNQYLDPEEWSCTMVDSLVDQQNYQNMNFYSLEL
ncbi:MAG: CHASE2 domain-containing protein [Termitinemataceae bacterium]